MLRISQGVLAGTLTVLLASVLLTGEASAQSPTEADATPATSSSTEQPTKTSSAGSGPLDYGLLTRIDDLPGLTVRDRSAVIGFWIVSMTFLVVVTLFITHQLWTGEVTVYRRYEKRLLELNRLSLQELLAYHAQFKWGAYSGTAIGMVLVCIPLLIINSDSMSAVQLVVQSFAVALMSVAVILLVVADLVHTNTQTPILPVAIRFKLINFSVNAGTVGTGCLVFSVLYFTSMILSWPVTLGCCGLLFVLFLFGHRMRGIKKPDLFRHFGIVDEDLWLRGHEDGPLSDDGEHIKSWPSKSSEPLYQSMREYRPLYVVVDHWIQEMFSRGVLEEEDAKAARLALTDHRSIAVEKRDPEFLAESFRQHMREPLETNPGWRARRDEIVKALAEKLGWDESQADLARDQDAPQRSDGDGDEE